MAYLCRSLRIVADATLKSKKSVKRPLFIKKLIAYMFTLIDLPYAQDALQPVISEQTLSFHYGKHLQTYVDNLNRLIAGTEYEQMPLEQIVCKSQGGIFNNAGQVLNHNLYFTQFMGTQADSPSNLEGVARSAGGVLSDDARQAVADEPSASQADEAHVPYTFMQAITRDFGSFDNFKAEFEKAGTTLFGSGWVWLSVDQDGKLIITQETNANNPITKGLRPLLTMDVWEHAYYLDYQNRRAAHLQALWDIINWEEIERRYTKIV